MARKEDPLPASPGVTDWLVQPFSSVYAHARPGMALRAVPLAEGAGSRGRGAAPGRPARIGILDTEPEERFDRLTRLAAASSTCRSPWSASSTGIASG